MKNSQQKSFSRIGAYELKVSYQRNMLASTLIVSILALVAIFCLTMDRSEAIPFERHPPTDTFIVILPAPPTVIQDQRDIPRVKPSKPDPIGIPTPVPDEELPDDWDDLTIATQDELKDYIDDFYSSPDIGDGDVVVYDVPDDDGYPSKDDWVDVQIQPQMIYEAKPEYPRLARKTGMEDDVWIKALVDIDGSVVDAVVFKSSGSNLGFDQAAIKAAKQCKYSPGIQNGFPVPVWVWVCYKVEFRLNR